MDERELDYETERYLQRLDHKEKSSRMANKNPCRITMGKEEARKLLALEAEEDSNPAYQRRSLDQTNKNKDYLREGLNEEKYRKKEESYIMALKLWRYADGKQKEGKALSDSERKILKKEKSYLKEGVKVNRSKRIQAGNLKETAWQQKTRIETELKRYRSAGDRNMIEQESEDSWTKIYNNAPKSVLQSLKRSEAEVGREVARQLCISDNLKKLDYNNLYPLLKEYKECYSVKDEMWAVLTKIMEILEQNKASLSRLGLAETCFTILTRENQMLHAKAVDVLMSNDSTKYEMKLQALSTLRSKQVNRDGKTDSQISMRAAIKEKELINKFNKIVKTDRTRRRNNFKENKSYRPRHERNRGRYEKDKNFKKPFVPRRGNNGFKREAKKDFKDGKKGFTPQFKGRDRKFTKKNKAIKQEPKN